MRIATSTTVSMQSTRTIFRSTSLQVVRAHLGDLNVFSTPVVGLTVHLTPVRCIFCANDIFESSGILSGILGATMNWQPTFSRLSQWKCEKNDKHVRSKHLLIRSSSDYKIEVIVDKKYDFDHARPIFQ